MHLSFAFTTGKSLEKLLASLVAVSHLKATSRADHRRANSGIVRGVRLRIRGADRSSSVD